MTFEEYVDSRLDDKPMNDLFERPRESASSSMRLRLRTKYGMLVKEALMNAEPVPENVVIILNCGGRGIWGERLLYIIIIRHCILDKPTHAQKCWH